MIEILAYGLPLLCVAQTFFIWHLTRLLNRAEKCARAYADGRFAADTEIIELRNKLAAANSRIETLENPGGKTNNFLGKIK